MTRLLVATTNPGKLAEFAIALANDRIEVVGLDTLATFEPIEETGSTFEANARLKAEAHSKRTDLLVVADDSGLEVDALNGAPGVHSARYAGPTLDDAARTRALLDALSAIPDAKRTARFRCVLAAARAGVTVAIFEGVVEGRILQAPRGTNGFGYDPIFFHHAAARTFAELTREEKTRLSHRGQAVKKLAAALRGQTLNC